jgi:hypothetical protein
MSTALQYLFVIFLKFGKVAQSKPLLYSQFARYKKRNFAQINFGGLGHMFIAASGKNGK